jgi:kumamolisin
LSRSGAFRDITVGNNDPTNGLIGGYSARPGWDPCTGWGSPDGTVLLETLSRLAG